MSGNDLLADAMSWHDNLIYGLHLEAPDPDSGNWQSNLLLDIDHIVEWVCGTDGDTKFLVAPATLAFHNVTGLRIDVDFCRGGRRECINEMSIASISKEPVFDHGGTESYVCFGWRIELNLPAGSEIAFYASGYTQTLRAEPILLDQPRLPANQMRTSML
jgi:hypothetical protein